jgi:hypothetical protein
MTSQYCFFSTDQLGAVSVEGNRRRKCHLLGPVMYRRREADALELKGIKISECTELRVQSGSDFA